MDGEVRTEGIQPFTLSGTTFHCFSRTDGRFVWRSENGRFAVGRHGAKCWARADGAVIGADYGALIEAMRAATEAAARRKAA